ncbi:heavy-metal-associated domain-containing protein [Neisseria yangbaofengii]|uniref:heavy-metal-associated domain-containing protein n=1 Tax=Neisseria yangbaofengii TaxID=2709396 RepID=UPI0013EA15AF|nr:heavy-metal-associated domain-containing protein [Neisseria yangbaofengii]
MESITLNVEGMTCGGCVKSVTRILENTDGVAKAEVSLENKSAVIEFDAAKTNVDALIEAIGDGGFDASR